MQASCSRFSCRTLRQWLRLMWSKYFHFYPQSPMVSIDACYNTFLAVIWNAVWIMRKLKSFDLKVICHSILVLRGKRLYIWSRSKGNFLFCIIQFMFWEDICSNLFILKYIWLHVHCKIKQICYIAKTGVYQ